MRMTRSIQWTLAAVIFSIPPFLTAKDTNAIPKSLVSPQADDIRHRMYSVVVMNIRNEEKYNLYIEKLTKVIMNGQYMTRGERILNLHTEAEDAPQKINIVYYETPAVHKALIADPAFKKIVPIRDKNATMTGIDGYAVGGDYVAGAVTERVYMVEFVYFKDKDGLNIYNHYLEKSQPLLNDYGFHVERTIKPTAAFGDTQLPDLVNIVYFESGKKMAEMQKDPRHQAVEKLYVDSVKNSIWYSGNAIY